MEGYQEQGFSQKGEDNCPFRLLLHLEGIDDGCGKLYRKLRLGNSIHSKE
jgi:hypothetical protein